MAKIIKLTPELKDELRAKFEKALSENKCQDGVFKFSSGFAKTENRKATIFIESTAWEKMFLLLEHFETEVGWHYLARRGDDPEKDEYIIYDVLVYPQVVTGTTVNTDQIKYQDWILAQPDGVFEHIRAHGHSHVRMGTTPSGVDIDHQGRILDQVKDGDFYIFMIWNKQLTYTAKIYDLGKNVMFESKDISVQYLGQGFDYVEFLKEADGAVEKKAWQSSYSGSNYSGSNYSGGSKYSSDYYGSKTTPPVTPPAAPPVTAPVTPVTPPAASADNVTPPADVRSKATEPAKTSGVRWVDADDDDDDDLLDAFRYH